MDNPTKLATVSKVVTDLTVTNTGSSDNLAIPDVSYGKVALNVYQIYPKKIVYPLNGFSTITTANQMIMSEAGTVLDAKLFKINFETAYIKVNYIDDPKDINIEYVDKSGNPQKTTKKIQTIADEYVFTDIWNINRITLSGGTKKSAFNVQAYTIPSIIYRYSINETNCGSAVITVPNGYIGVISDIYFYSTALGDLQMYVKDLRENIKTVQTFKNMAIFSGRYNHMGSFNYTLYPGESVYFGAGTANMGDTYVHAIVTMTAV